MQGIVELWPLLHAGTSSRRTSSKYRQVHRRASVPCVIRRLAVNEVEVNAADLVAGVSTTSCAQSFTFSPKRFELR